MEQSKIISAIKDYINKRTYNYALLLDGDWGCGKTHFVNETLIPELVKTNKNYNFINISLYGITNTEEISKQLFMQKYLKKNNSKITSVINITSKVFSTITSFSPDNILSDLEVFADFKNTILIFDDLERCNMPISDILGYISNFVESNNNDNISTIIIANQNEIGKSMIINNMELKYLVALDQQIIVDIPEDRYEFSSNYLGNNNNPQRNFEVSTEDLKKRINYIFGENYIYNQIKEKIIGITIQYEPDFETVIPILLNRYFENKHDLSTIQNKTQLIKKILVEKKHSNIRTLQFALEKYCLVLHTLDCLKDEDAYDVLITETLSYCLTIAIDSKSGKDKPETKKDRTNKESYSSMPSSSNPYTFIDNLIYDSMYDEETAMSIFKAVLETKKLEAELPDDPFHMTNNWWLREDEDIDSNLKKIIANINNNSYSLNLYIKILQLISYLDEAGFDVNSNEMLNTMKRNIDKSDIDSLRKVSFHYGPFENMSPKYQGLLIELKEHLSSARKGVIHDINTIFSKDNWAVCFSDFCICNKSELIASGSFLGKVDVKLLMDRLKNCKNSDLSNFRNTLFSVYEYDTETLKSDLKSIEEINKSINELLCENCGKIKTFHLKLITKRLSKIVQEISKEQENENSSSEI